MDSIEPALLERWTHGGIDCGIARARALWHFAGYARLPAGHPDWALADAAHELQQAAARNDAASGSTAAAFLVENDVILGYTGLGDAYQVHGGVTYGADADGWIGFDTGHAPDWWAVEDWTKAAGDEAHRDYWPALKRDLARLCAISRGPAEIYGTAVGAPPPWTFERLRVETCRLAEQVAQRAEQRR